MNPTQCHFLAIQHTVHSNSFDSFWCRSLSVNRNRLILYVRVCVCMINARPRANNYLLHAYYIRIYACLSFPFHHHIFRFTCIIFRNHYTYSEYTRRRKERGNLSDVCLLFYSFLHMIFFITER